MAFFDVLKQTITGRPINITVPTFIRDECDALLQLKKMNCGKYGDDIINIVKKNP